VNNKTRILLQYWDFHYKNIGEAWSLLEWIAWDSFEFENASRIYGYSFHDPCVFYARSYYAPLWCVMCSSSDHNITSCPYYACFYQPDFASPKDNTDVVLTLPDSSLPLAQCTGFEGGEPFGYATRFSGISAYLESEETFDVVHNLVDTPLEGHRDVFMHEESPSLACDNVLPSPLDHFHVSTFCSQPSFSP